MKGEECGFFLWIECAAGDTGGAIIFKVGRSLQMAIDPTGYIW